MTSSREPLPPLSTGGEPQHADVRRVLPSGMSGGQLALTGLGFLFVGVGAASPFVGEFGIVGNFVFGGALLALGVWMLAMTRAERRRWCDLRRTGSAWSFIEGAGRTIVRTTHVQDDQLRGVRIEMDGRVAGRSFGHHLEVDYRPDGMLVLFEMFNIPKEDLEVLRQLILTQPAGAAADNPRHEPR